MSTLTNAGASTLQESNGLVMPEGLSSQGISRSSLVTSRLLAPLGVPTLPVELNPDYTLDVVPALSKYYTYLPIMRAYHQSFFYSVNREAVINIEDLTQFFFKEDKSYYYLGYVSYALRNAIGQGRFDEYLLGIPFVIPSYDPERLLLQDTLIDINTGDPVIYEDLTEGTVRIIVGGACYLTVNFGFGNYDLEKVPIRNIELITLLIGQQYYKRLLSIRSTGNFPSADFQISSELLQNSLKDAEERGNQLLLDASDMAITRG